RSSASKNYGTNRLIMLSLAQSVLERRDQLVIQRVAFLRTVQFNLRDRIAHFIKNHWLSLVIHYFEFGVCALPGQKAQFPFSVARSKTFCLAHRSSARACRHHPDSHAAENLARPDLATRIVRPHLCRFL